MVKIRHIEKGQNVHVGVATMAAIQFRIEGVHTVVLPRHEYRCDPRNPRPSRGFERIKGLAYKEAATSLRLHEKTWQRLTTSGEWPEDSPRPTIQLEYLQKEW